MNNNHIVKRAIIMAAGIGKRMQPLTFEIPKPLIRVNGVRMIDTIIQGLHANGIFEIYVVTGYLKEQFKTWASQYHDVQLIDNPFYETCNNISSLYVVRDKLKDCMILDGDQLIFNKTVLNPHFSLSGYNAEWCDEKTNEWLLEVKNGKICSCSRNGGIHGWRLYSVSRWTAEDGEKLCKHLEQEFDKGNTNIFWDDVAMFCYFNEYQLGIREVKKGDIIEIDGIDELVSYDPTYKKYLTEIAGV